MNRTITSAENPDIPSGWRIEVATNRRGQAAAVVFDQDNIWVVEARTADEALRLALGG